MAKIEVKGAFVQPEMVGLPVYIKCRKRVTDLMVKRFPGLKRYNGSDGLLYFKLFKALMDVCRQVSFGSRSLPRSLNVRAMNIVLWTLVPRGRLLGARVLYL
jgi:hypothetical protein